MVSPEPEVLNETDTRYVKVWGKVLGLDNKSRMRRESHVRFCEREGGKFPLPTRLPY